MATLATYYRKMDTSVTPGPEERANPYLLRNLPNEDLYFYKKSIDNSRLVREADPRARGECWSTIGAVCAVAIVVLTTLAPSVAGIMAGYQLQSLKQDQQRLLNERSTLQVEEARLLSPERLERLAREQQMVSPKPGQVLHLSAATGERVALLKESGSREPAE